MATRSDDRAEFNSQIPLDGNRHEAQATGATVIAGALLGVSLLALIKRKKKDEKDKTQKDADDKQDVGNEGDDAAPNPTVDGAGQNAGDGANNAGKGVKGGPCGCFIAGTDVLTPSGLVDIETIDIGDLVMAWREDGTGYGSYPVSALIRPPSRVIRQLTLLDAQGNIETFETTDDHPWHVSEGPVNEGHDGAVGNQGNFLRTDELAAGMEISTQDGDGVSVIEVIKTTERAPTYNLTVADAHTFFVGNDGIWVHNTDCIPNSTRFPDGTELNINLPRERLDHVLHGEVKSNGSVSGGHSTNSGTVRTVGTVETNAQGVRRATVKVNGQTKNNSSGGKSTLFPEAWSDQRIVQEFSDGLKNGVTPVRGRQGRFETVTPSGIVIRFFRDPNGRIMSFFPRF